MQNNIINLTKQQLVDLQACPEGIDFFNKIAPSGELNIEMTSWLFLMLSSSKYIGNWAWWLQEKNIISNIEIKNECLISADLSEAMFKNITFFNCNFHGANLENAEFSKCKLTYCDFVSANLSRANLSNSNLKMTNFVNADLSDADLSGTNLNEAVLYYANLNWAYYPEGILPKDWQRNSDGYLISE